MKHSPQDFRQLLQKELLKRCAKNQGYSLRAFAKSLDVNPSTLSHLIKGKRKLTDTAIRTIGNSLQLSPHEIFEYCQSNEVRDFRKRHGDPRVSEIEFKELAVDTFHLVSEWYHDAILELTRIGKFKSNPKWIASVLGVTVTEVNIAVERLQRLGMLEIQPNGKWKDLSTFNTTIKGEFTNSAQKKYQKVILKKSIDSIDEVDISDRDHTSMMLTLPKRDLPKIKEKIKKMRRELASFIRKSTQEHDEVYQVTISLFPISFVQKNGGKK